MPTLTPKTTPTDRHIWHTWSVWDPCDFASTAAKTNGRDGPPEAHARCPGSHWVTLGPQTGLHRSDVADHRMVMAIQGAGVDIQELHEGPEG